MSNTATKQFFGIEYDPEVFKVTHYECDEPYEKPKKLIIEDLISHMQPWSGYVPPESNLPKEDSDRLEVSRYNIKSTARYHDAEMVGNKWMRMACAEALKSVQNKGGPFGSVMVQVDDESNRVIRYWLARNHVTEWLDPTAHGEITAIRQVCQELGVFNLGKIVRTPIDVAHGYREMKDVVHHASLEDVLEKLIVVDCPACLDLKNPASFPRVGVCIEALQYLLSYTHEKKSCLELQNMKFFGIALCI